MLILYVIVGFGVAFLVALMTVRRSMRRWRRDSKPTNFDFTLGELQVLRNTGKLTPEQFERAKATVLRRAAEAERNSISDRRVNETKRGFDVIMETPAPRNDNERNR